MKVRNVVGLCIIIGFSLLGTVGAAILFFKDVPDSWISGISLWADIIGTLASVVLSVLAMVYSNRSSKATEDSLEEIKKQYRTLCEKIINNELPTGKNGVTSFVEKEESKML